MKATTIVFALLGIWLGASTALAAPPAGKSASNKGPSVQVADAARLEKAINAEHGKVILVNFWATWCDPCVAEFPSIVRLYNRYKGEGLMVIAVSGDEENILHTKVIPFLKRQKTTFPAFIKPKGNAQAFINAIDTSWEGTVPRTYLIGRNGRVRQAITGTIDVPKVEQTLRLLLAEKPDTTSARAASEAHPKGILGGS